MRANPRKRSVPDAPAGELGARIRKARHERGLSLAAVAGDDFSRAFLSQVELGRARPSTRTLQIIAERLQRPIEWFLEDPDTSRAAIELSLTEAEMRLRRGNAVEARSLLTELLARPYLPPEGRTRAHLLLGEAHLRLGNVQEALPVLQKAIKASEAGKWMPLTIELYDRMGSAYYMLRRPPEAGRWFDKALSAFEASTLTEPILKARILGHRANLYYVAGQWQEAIALYETAIEAAEHVLDVQGLAGIYEGLARSFRKTGELDRALTYAQRSLRLWEGAQDVRMTAQLRDAMGSILLEQGQYQEAERQYLEGADRLRLVGDKEFLPHLLAGGAEAALELGNPELASDRVETARAAAGESSDPVARLEVERVAGRVAHALGRVTESRDHFEQALAIAAAANSAVDQANVAYDYARTLEAQGDLGQAVLRYREAYELRRAAIAS